MARLSGIDALLEIQAVSPELAKLVADVIAEASQQGNRWASSSRTSMALAPGKGVHGRRRGARGQVLRDRRIRFSPGRDGQTAGLRRRRANSGPENG